MGNFLVHRHFVLAPSTGILQAFELQVSACPRGGFEGGVPLLPMPGAAGGGGGGAGPHGNTARQGYGRPEDGGVWAAKTVKRPQQQPAQPPIRQLLGATDAQTAHPATFSTAPAHQRLGSANAETTPAGAPAAAADRTQRPDATCEGQNG